jgi:hypothetical protein
MSPQAPPVRKQTCENCGRTHWTVGWSERLSKMLCLTCLNLLSPEEFKDISWRTR